MSSALSPHEEEPIQTAREQRAGSDRNSYGPSPLSASRNSKGLTPRSPARVSSVTLAMKVLVALLSLFIASGALAGESLTMDQVWERRTELDKKTVRASFEWHYNFEVSDAHVWMPDGTVRNLRVEFDSAQLSRSAPVEWKKIEDANRSYWAQVKRAAQKKKEGPKDLWFLIEADVEVSLPPPQKDPDVIVLGPDLFLRVTSLHSVRKEEANQSAQTTPVSAPR